MPTHFCKIQHLFFQDFKKDIISTKALRKWACLITFPSASGVFRVTAVLTNCLWCGSGRPGLLEAISEGPVHHFHPHSSHFDGICYSLEESQRFWVKRISPNNVDIIIPESQPRIQQDLTVMTRTGERDFLWHSGEKAFCWSDENERREHPSVSWK